jgi:sigma-B regulation protein RsbU (phosphoserine phosphatase)
VLRILHIEDDPVDAELVFNAMTANSPCQVFRVASKAGLEAALTYEVFDLIVSDSSLLGLDGKAALRLAKIKFPEVPFVFCSGHSSKERKCQMMSLGATDYFSKEDIEGLIRLIAELSESVLCETI